MNAAARALAQSNWLEGNMFSLSITKRQWLVFFLIMVLITSAMAVIYVKMLNRHLYTELQEQSQTRDHLQVEWSQLLLEQSTFATQARISYIAGHGLHMTTPQSSEVIVVRRR